MWLGQGPIWSFLADCSPPLMTAYEELSKDQMKEVNDAILSMKRLNYDEIASLIKNPHKSVLGPMNREKF